MPFITSASNFQFYKEAKDTAFQKATEMLELGSTSHKGEYADSALNASVAKIYLILKTKITALIAILFIPVKPCKNCEYPNVQNTSKRY